MAFDDILANACKEFSFYVPKTNNDLQNIVTTTNIDQLEQPVRIWTDYIRINKTHFWSNTANDWWSIFHQQESLKNNNPGSLGEFRDSVTFNVQLKWAIKCLVLGLIASVVFAAIKTELLWNNCRLTDLIKSHSLKIKVINPDLYDINYDLYSF